MVKRVPSAVTVMLPETTLNGRSGSCATSKAARPASRVSRRASPVICTEMRLSVSSVSCDPSSSVSDRI